ncbi:site-specific integrase [Gaetbulibacter sp. M240]|uniref:tyrosine-type recombinase/integrase n=1 Tax=Gaetbulibacter sp. M240 TaxID=3126511 RepID=UPI00374F283E
MASVNFLYRSTKDSAELILRLLFRSNDIDYVVGAKSGIEVSKYYWTKEHKKKNPRDIDILDRQAEVNGVLNKLKSYILTKFKETNPEDIDKDWLKTQIDAFHNPPKETPTLPNELLKYFKYFIKEKTNDLAKSTVKKYNVVYSLLERYETSAKKKLLLKDVDLSFKKSFEDYCFSKGYAPNTITRAIRAIKTACNHARYNGIETSYQLEKLKTKYTKTENIYLTLEDIEKLKNIQKEKLADQLENARDWLVISCFTGQRVSDFMRFNKKMLRQETNKDGKLVTFIEFAQQKTGKEMTIPLKQDVLDILDKRGGDFPPRISDQKYNLYIKEVGAIAKLNEKVLGSKKLETEPGSGIYRKVTKKFKKHELISSHIGRRSFATNFYGQIPTSFLIYVTGHKTEQMFLNYIGKSNKDIALELTKYF